MYQQDLCGRRSASELFEPDVDVLEGDLFDHVEADDEAAGALVAQHPNVLVTLLARSVPEL